MEVEIRVDRARCMGSGQCVHWAPGVFDQDDDGISIVVDPRGDPEEKIVHAVTSCPVQAITLHVDGTVVRQEDLRDWVVGVRSDDAVVAVLTDLCDDHHELRTALMAAAGSPDGGGPDGADAMCALTSAHLRHEEEAYRAITALVDRQLVDAFESDHDRIDRALADLAAHRSDDVERRRAMRDVAQAVDDHIRLEETVLFPVALAALARSPA
jgi:ferredoxin